MDRRTMQTDSEAPQGRSPGRSNRHYRPRTPQCPRAISVAFAVSATAIALILMLGTHRAWAQDFLLEGADVLAETDSGAVIGRATPTVKIFRGIPFARAPVGKLRFRPPLP